MREGSQTRSARGSANMRGAALPVFAGVDTYYRRGQRGGGIGSALTGVLRSLLPVLAPVAKDLGGKLLAAGMSKLQRTLGGSGTRGATTSGTSRPVPMVIGDDPMRARQRRRLAGLKNRPRPVPGKKKKKKKKTTVKRSGAGGQNAQRGAGVGARGKGKKRTVRARRTSVAPGHRSREDVFGLL